jgi:hypothetical protein
MEKKARTASSAALPKVQFHRVFHPVSASACEVETTTARKTRKVPRLEAGKDAWVPMQRDGKMAGLILAGCQGPRIEESVEVPANEAQDS